ncbi:hypothetical protein EV182_001912, partial [Spiromyces aspiralis]
MDAFRNQIAQALVEITSQNPATIKDAEARLKSWEHSPRFYPVLQDVFIDKSFPADVRLLAVIHLKNGVDRYWRKTSRNALSEEDKQAIQSRLLENFNEPSRQIAVQNSVLISRVARWSNDSAWPDLLPSLARLIVGVATLSLPQRTAEHHTIEQNAMYCLHLIIKTQCSRTLAINRRALQQVSPALLGEVLKIYNTRVYEFFATIQTGQAHAAMDALREVRFALKIIRRLL